MAVEAPEVDSPEVSEPEGDFAELDALIEDNTNALRPDDAPEQSEFDKDHSKSDDRPRDENGRFKKREEVKRDEPEEGSEEVAETPAIQPIEDDEPESTDEFDDDLFARAAEFNISQEAARRYGSRANIEHALGMFDAQKAAAALAAFEAKQQQQPQQAAAPTPQQPVVQQSQAQEQTPSTLEKYKLEMNPELFDEETIKLVNGLNDHYHNQFVKQDELVQVLLEAALQQNEFISKFTSQSQADEQARTERDMDSWFDSLGNEWEAEFGKGPAAELPENSPQLLARQKVARQMRGLALSYEGKAIPDLTKLANRALGSLYYDQIHSRARQAVTAKAKKFNGQAVARPNGVTGKTGTPDQNARRFVEQFMRERGVKDDDEDYGL